jgi:hypothetical protein
MPNLLTQHGAQPQKQPKYVPIFIDRAFTGLYTQRAVLHDPSDIYTSRYYGGRPDALWMGQNIELTNRLTLQRRPGLTQFSSFPYPTSPLRSYPFQLLDGTIRVIIDTGTSGNLSVTSVTAGSGSAVYFGTFPAGAGNGYVGLIFSISGFTNTNNNTTSGFVCTASTATTLTLANASGGTTETAAAVAVTSGGVFWDQQNGSAVLLFGKAVGAGQTYFTAVAGILYMGDGVEVKKYTPANTFATIVAHTPPQPSTTTNTVWNWGGIAPSVPIATSVTASGSAAGTWQPNTWFSTMGVIIDPNGNIQQLTNVTKATVANTIGNVGLIGISSSGGPNWNFTPGTTTNDGPNVVWRCLSAIKLRVPSGTLETETVAYATNGFDCAYYEQKSGEIAVCIHTTSSSQNSGLPLPGNQVAPGQKFADDGNNEMMALGTAPGASPAQNNIPNGFCQGQWKPNQVIPSQANPPVRLIIPFTIPQPGFPLPQTLYLFEQITGGTTSAAGNISWASAVGVPTTEPAGSDGSILTWTCVTANGSSNGMTGQWVANSPYMFWNSPQNAGFGVAKDKDTNPNGTGTGTSLWVAVSAAAPGASGSGTSGGSDPFAKYYYQRGGHSYNILDTIVDNFGNVQQVSVAGTSGATAPTWNRNQGQTTVDNGTLRWINKGSACGIIKVIDNDIQWINIGAAVNCVWTANQKFYLPTSGFNAPILVPFGSIDINDTTNIEFVSRTGVSGGSIPSWNASTQPGSNETYDPSPAASGSVTWYNNGPFKQSSLSWSSSHTWAYSYKARSTTDFYSVASGTPALIPVPPGSATGSNGLSNPPRGSQANTITTASAATTISGASSGTVVVTLYGNYSSDPQFDTIIIWRDPDGIGSSGMLELTEIANHPELAGHGGFGPGAAYDWFFNDFLPDTPTGSFPGLNPLIQAPINHLNDPPFSSYRPMEYNFQRIWGSYLLQVNFSAGPDEAQTGGNPNEAFPPADELPFLAPVQRLVRTPQGLIALTTDSVELLAGGPQTQTFYSVRLSAGMGLSSFNALDTYAGEIFFFSSDNQFYLLSPSLSISNFGFPLGDQFANMPSSGILDTTWDPSKVYVAVHQSGIDNCIFVCDGSIGWYRLNPRQVPGAAQGPEPIWSPFAIITGGAHMVQSVEYTPGKKSLLVGGTGAGQTISKRTLGVYTDNGTQYDAFYVMGSIVLAHPGQLALLKFLEADFSGVPNASGIGFRPTISYLLNEISGTFVPFVAAPQFDPPSIYGARIFPKSYSPNRYYFASNAALARCRHLQIRVDYGVSPNPDEIFDLTIYGRMVVEF